MEDRNQQLDYNGILMTHLSRISYITTSSFIDAINKDMNTVYINPQTSGEKALEWGMHYLTSLIPDDVKDEAFNEEYKKANLSKDKTTKEFLRFRSVINLLHRNNLLMPNVSIARKKKKIEEVWNDN